MLKNLFKRIFQKQKRNAPAMPPWEEIVEQMYDKCLDFDGEVVKVIYSKDRSKRYVVLKNEKGYFTYCLEAIYPFDEEEWNYICMQENALPAMWQPFWGITGKSLFESMDELRREKKEEPEYKRYFL